LNYKEKRYRTGRSVSYCFQCYLSKLVIDVVGTAVVELAVGTVTVIVCDVVGNVVVEGARVLGVGGVCVTVVVGAVLYNIKQRIL
jgi:hypothetical protein